MLNVYSKGYSDIVAFNLKDTLNKLQILIYSLTKEYLEDHAESLELYQKLQVPFKKVPGDKLWKEVMTKVNSSKELKDLITDADIVKKFELILKKPKIFPISFFRARLPEQKKVIYNWHQDEGTWMKSKDKNIIGKNPVTLWLSINGSNKNNSIQLIENSHKYKLLKHSQIEGQGYFNADVNVKLIDPSKIMTVETKPSEGIFFHPLTLHKSVDNNIKTLKPRYSVDIRYYDDNLFSKFKNIFK